MKPNRSLKEAFPRQAEVIDLVRQQDPQFDEICADYELLVSDLDKFERAKCNAKQQTAIMVEILGELEEEIAETLSAFEKTRSLK